MGGNNSKDEFKKDLDDNNNNSSNKKNQTSILKNRKCTLISLENTSPNIIKNAKEYLESIKEKKKNKKKDKKRVSIKIENNEYYFMDNTKNYKKINYGSSQNLNNIAKEKFLDDLLSLNDNDEEKEEIKNKKDNKTNLKDKKKTHMNYINLDNSELRRRSLSTKLRILNEFKFTLQDLKIENNEIKPNIDNTLFIFNWDDTLLCTSYLQKNKNLTEEEKEQMKKCENEIYELINNTLIKGKIFLITNLDMANIETSIIKYYPSLHSRLNEVEIISTNRNLDNNSNWKISAFVENQKNVNNDNIKNIICFTDSYVQDNIVKILRKIYHFAIIKVIKFKECPDPYELGKQFVLVNHKFNDIYNDKRDLFIKIEKNKF